MPPTEPESTPKRPRVLVIDDSRVIRKAVSNILNNDFDLKEAEDGEAGWQALADDNTVEVVISDIEMPKLDGYQLICRIRAAEENRVREVPIIVITGAQDEQTRERAYACGATDFITKPLDSIQLLARARAHSRLDQTTRKLAETETALEEQTAVDPLTQLNSRRYFLQRATQDHAYGKRHDEAVSIVRLAVDDFAGIGAKHGATVADQVLIWVAKLIQKTCRTEDTAAHIAPAQFAVIAPASDRVHAAVLCERLRTAVAAQPFAQDGISIPVTISLGLATLGRDPGDTIEEMLKLADQRLTLAKADGGNRLGVIYQDEMPEPEEAVMEEPDIETALRLIQNGDGGKLIPYLPGLMNRLAPLLTLCDKNLELGLGIAIEALREQFPEDKK
ncbi:MAG: diguanylate cyclase [Pseudomonadota bacterium]|nr:MAG: diguanylate cyclase [Pseudomonadota bacterium]